MVRREFLIFTSAGDRSCVAQWLGGGDERRFDLFVCYYGTASSPSCLAHADRATRRKGGKFQNLHAAVETDRAYFAAYDAILVCDDDIRIDTR